jgi:predicted transposase YbfD/YdcC
MIPDHDTDTFKQTNEIKVAAPMLDTIFIKDKNITADALLTQRKFATYLVDKRKAHYFFTVKSNQPTLKEDIEFYFDNIDRRPDFISQNTGHGRKEDRRIWTTPDLKGYLDFPYVEQAFKIERSFLNIKTGKVSREIVYGITSRSEDEMDAKKILKIVRNHWSIENSCHYILDWNFDEDRCRIKTGHGPENITCLRRLAISIIKSKKVSSVAQKMRQLSFNTRTVLDYLKISKNSHPMLKPETLKS